MPKPNKKNELRKFLKKLPKRKFLTERQIGDKFSMTRSNAYWRIRELKIELGLQSELRYITAENGRDYLMRVWWKE